MAATGEHLFNPSAQYCSSAIYKENYWQLALKGLYNCTMTKDTLKIEAVKLQMAVKWGLCFFKELLSRVQRPGSTYSVWWHLNLNKIFNKPEISPKFYYFGFLRQMLHKVFLLRTVTFVAKELQTGVLLCAKLARNMGFRDRMGTKRKVQFLEKFSTDCHEINFDVTDWCCTFFLLKQNIMILHNIM